MQLIERVELTSSQASITFSNIPQDGTDLLIKFSLRDNLNGGGEAREFYVDLNSTQITSYRVLVGNGSSASSNTSYLTLLDGASATANTFGSGHLYLPNYTSSNNKSISIDAVTETNGTVGFQVLTAALSTVTAAITSITLRANSASFVQYSSATLYKITKGSDGTTTVA